MLRIMTSHPPAPNRQDQRGKPACARAARQASVLQASDPFHILRGFRWPVLFCYSALAYTACNNPTASAGVTMRTPW
jgi:hypothetical protein